MIYDPGHPNIGTIKNNLGRVLLETGEFDKAEGLLRDALAGDRAHHSEEFDDLVLTLKNLALVRFAQGEYIEPMDLLQEALQISQNLEHRLTGPVMINLADLKCLTQPSTAGLDLAVRGRGLVAEEFGIETWRMARAELTIAYCQLQTNGNIDLERTALNDFANRIAERWGEASFFAQRTKQQLAELLQTN